MFPLNKQARNSRVPTTIFWKYEQSPRDAGSSRQLMLLGLDEYSNASGVPIRNVNKWAAVVPPASLYNNVYKAMDNASNTSFIITHSASTYDYRLVLGDNQRNWVEAKKVKYRIGITINNNTAGGQTCNVYMSAFPLVMDWPASDNDGLSYCDYTKDGITSITDAEQVGNGATNRLMFSQYVDAGETIYPTFELTADFPASFFPDDGRDTYMVGVALFLRTTGLPMSGNLNVFTFDIQVTEEVE